MKASLSEHIALLNSQQREAVLAPIDRPILVVAGAGSGKTRVLTLRVAYLVNELGIPESRILAVTFTNKAADEMKERLSRFVNVKRLNVGTFHSVALRIIREEMGERVVFDDEDSRALLKEVLSKVKLSNKVNFFRLAITRFKNTKEYPKEMERDLFLSVYEDYQRRLREAKALDFDDILIEAVKILEDERIRLKYSKRFFYVLVDEYQDTNPLQHDMIKLIAGAPDHRRVFVVGDEDQSIYSFRGADFRIFLNFKRDFPNARILKLEVNYRSTQDILDLANRLIEHNTHRREKVLRSHRGRGDRPSYMHFYSDREEAEWIAKTIKSSYDPGDVMILYRSNYLSKSVEDALLKFGVPYTLVGDISFYQRKEVKDLVAYLRLTVNPSDFLALDRVVGTLEGLGDKAASILKDVIVSFPLEEINEEHLENAGLKGKRLKAALNLIELLRDASSSNPQVALIKVIEGVDYFNYLKKIFPENYESRIENVNQLLNMASEYDNTLDFINHISLLSSVDTKERRSTAALMTVHAAKGLERDVVFVIGLEEETFPHYKSLEEGNIEEERRLAYVAITRARRKLYLSSAESRGWKKGLKRSRFLYEMGIVGWEVKEEHEDVTFKEDGGKEDEFKRGEYVLHDRYGIGRVLRSDADTVVVLFSVGKKTFMKSQAKLRKLQR